MNTDKRFPSEIPKKNVPLFMGDVKKVQQAAYWGAFFATDDMDVHERFPKETSVFILTNYNHDELGQFLRTSPKVY